MANPDPNLANILNFRDVGATVNGFLNQKRVKERLLYRSARPDDATVEDRRRLREEFGIRTVMDLRSKTEHANQAKKRDADRKIPVLLQSNAALAEPVQIPGLRYLEIKVTGRKFERHLLSQLSWWDFTRFLCLLLFGFRMEAIAILGRKVMRPRGLIGLAKDTMDQSGPELCQAMSSLLEPAALPTMIHCTQGKDRTGLLVALVLMVLDVPEQAITFDYELTDEALVPEKEGRLKEIRELGLPDNFGDTAPGMVVAMEHHLTGRYGGLDAYLDGIGFDSDRRDKLRELMLY